jgi:hypothetical protein
MNTAGACSAAITHLPPLLMVFTFPYRDMDRFRFAGTDCPAAQFRLGRMIDQRLAGCGSGFSSETGYKVIERPVFCHRFPQIISHVLPTM